jgi:D-serine deaminase-like pyridoxal phosphate-dependent protein
MTHEMVGRDLGALPTPAAVVDLDRMAANLDRMQRYAEDHGLGLRPHGKTHKALWLAEEQARRGALGLTVATPAEARILGAAARDLLVAYPALASRAGAVAEVAAGRAGRPTTVGLDSVHAVEALRDAVAAARLTDPVGVLVEVDVGMRRCGVADPAAAVAVARACGDGTVYTGVMFYPGHIREPVAEQDAALESLAVRLGEVVSALGDADLAPAVVSGGSTPTAFRSHEVPGQTEIRPGTYVFNDRTTAAIGACGWDECAYTVLATVVSTAVPGQAVVDAGSKALSSDELRAPGYGGYGQLLDRPEVSVVRLSEEHGVLDLAATDWLPRVRERVRIIPNHVCVSVNLQPVLYGVRDGVVVRGWAPEARGWG